MATGELTDRTNQVAPIDTCKLRLNVQSMFAIVEPANDAAAETFAEFEQTARRQLGVRIGLPAVGDSEASRIESVLASEVRTRRS